MLYRHDQTLEYRKIYFKLWTRVFSVYLLSFISFLHGALCLHSSSALLVEKTLDFEDVLKLNKSKCFIIHISA